VTSKNTSARPRQPLQSLRRSLKDVADPQRAKHSLRFFKTGKGEYGAGDQFLGITVPALRALARQYRDLPLRDVDSLLRSAWHEERLLALLLWVDRYRRGDAMQRQQIYQKYLRSTRYINNWDLVDTSAPYIVGAFLAEKDKRVLFRLARSANLWKRRIAVLATSRFIRDGRFTEILKIATLLLHDEHDLIHKAVGWMLREVGKRDRLRLERFLIRHQAGMPRTMLRYAIEHLPAQQRRRYLQGAASTNSARPRK
jgi:3-methyladenine DNA glycosylase AlkD